MLVKPLVRPIVRAIAGNPTASLGGKPSVPFLKVATFGDSTATVKTFAAGTAYTDQSVGDRETNGTVQSVIMATSKWRLYEKYPAAQLQIDGGISGQNTTQMLARSSGASDPARRAVEDVLALSPDIIIARCGSINDISGFTTATTQATIDAVYTRHMQIIEGLAAGGAYVLDEGIAGFDSNGASVPAAPDLAFIRATLISLNERFAAGISALGNPKIRFLNPVGITCDSSGAFLSGVSAVGDGTHLTYYGQGRVKDAENTLIRGWIGPSASTSFTGTNLIATEADYPNPIVPAFGTSAPNTTYFTWTVASGTRQNAAITTVNGIKYATCEMVPSGAGASLTFTARLVALLITPALVSAGDIVSIEADFIAEAISGGLVLGPSGLSAALQFGVSSSDRIVYSVGPTLNPTTGSEVSASGRFSFGKIKIPASIASLIDANTRINFSLEGQVGSNVRLSIGNVRIVKQ